MKAVGTKTANSTIVVATTGPETSDIAFFAASFAESFSSSISLTVFSTTTIESSTTIPIARTRPNRVRVLMEKPRTIMTANVPIRDTGIVIDGMRVVRQSWRNT